MQTSCSEPAVRLEGVGKRYRIFARREDRLLQPLFRRRRPQREFWALHHIDLAVPHGHTVGVVGVNGSGKSTLLELVAGTLQPTVGSRAVQGRVSAILDLGTGFNPEFTGRENVRLAAAVAGLDRRQTEERFDDMVAFADIGDFIEQPVKTYSSGMLLRLAFGVAVSVDAEVLVIDEILAVGDEAFQRKCFARLEAIQSGGATVLLASHDPTMILSLCDSVVLLDRGELLLHGDPKDVIAKYQQLAFAAPDARETLRETIRSATGRAERPKPRFDPELEPSSTVVFPSRGATIADPHVVDLHGERVNVLLRGHSYHYRYRVHFSETLHQPRFGMLIKTKAGFELGGSASSPPSQNTAVAEAGSTAEIDFRFRCLLLPDVYFLNAGVTAQLDGAEGYAARILDATAIRVQPEGDLAPTGLVDFEIEPGVTWGRER